MFTVILNPIWISVASIPSQVEYIPGLNFRISHKCTIWIRNCLFEVYRNLILYVQQRMYNKLSLTSSQVIVPITS